MKIKLFNLQRQTQQNIAGYMKALEQNVLEADFTAGKSVEEFENSFSAFCGLKRAVAVSSGSAALFLALKALDLHEGDEVITSPMSFIASSDTIIAAGAKPVFADVNFLDGNINVEQIARALTSRTRAVLVVHLHGVPCDMSRIKRLLKEKNVVLIEDASHAHGTTINGIPVGSFGLAGCFSLYPSKTLGAFGHAGIVVSKKIKYLEKISAISRNGIKNSNDPYKHFFHGYNEQMDGIQASILNQQMKTLGKKIKRKLKIANYYNGLLKNYGSGMFWPAESIPSLYVYSVKTNSRADFVNLFLKGSIEVRSYYPIPIHLQPSYKHYQYEPGSFPNAERFAQTSVSVPANAELLDSEVEVVGEKLVASAKKNMLLVSKIS